MRKAIIVAMVFFALTVMLSIIVLRLNTFNSKPPRKAAIVDQLSISQRNDNFMEKSLQTLTTAGFDVEYIESKLVTVSFYKDLPSQGYAFIILRVHSTVIEGTPSIGLFTSEIYDKAKYLNEAGILSGFIFGSDTEYFGVSPEFVTKSMNGRFDSTAIILMGCDGSKHSDLGEAFVNKGARVFVGWTGTVDITHTDTATLYFLQTLIQGKKSLRDAIIDTNARVGPDPFYGSILRFYPDAIGDETFP